MIETIILNYRHSDLTLRCIESLSGQVQRIWVVDNSQDDGHHQELVQGIAALSARTNRVKVEILKTPGNLGFAKGIQYGIDHITQHSATTLLLIINNDAIASPGMVRHMVTAMQEHGNCALVTSQETTLGGVPSVFWYHRGLALLLHSPKPGTFRYLSGACLLVPMQLTHPWLFDPDFFMYGEDIELSWRFSREGIPLVVSHGRFQHAGSASSRLGSLFYEYHVARGHVLLAAKLASNPGEKALLLAGRLVSLTARGIVRCLRYKNLEPARALFRALSNNPPPPPVA